MVVALKNISQTVSLILNGLIIFMIICFDIFGCFVVSFVLRKTVNFDNLASFCKIKFYVLLKNISLS